MTSLPQLIHGFVSDLAGVQRLVLAVSGGVDSMVLLHATVRAQLPQPLLVVHVNHQLSANASEWQSRVQKQCSALRIECVAAVVDVRTEGAGLEEAARQARYRAIEHYLQPGDLVLMAHHAQDQLETFFLRLARGAGVRGLAGMAPLRQLGPARLGRPFLPVGRSAIEEYARQHSLTWVEDESNSDERFDRNYLRLNILPLLQQRWRELPRQVGQAMEHLQAADALLDDYAAEDLQCCHPRRERLGLSIEAVPLLGWTVQRRNNLIRHWLTQQGYRPPSQKRLAELDSLLRARQDQNPLLYWGDCELRRFGERVFCLPSGWRRPPAAPLMCSTERIADLGNSHLSWASASPGLPHGDYQVLVRELAPQIERAQPISRLHSQVLKKLLQEYRLEPWLRNQVPLIFQGDKLVAVADLWIEKSAAVDHGVVPVWSFPLPSVAHV